MGKKEDLISVNAKKFLTCFRLKKKTFVNK